MRDYCAEIMKNPKLYNERIKNFKAIISWYEQQISKYNEMLKQEIMMRFPKRFMSTILAN